jgi:hypothetical protein
MVHFNYKLYKVFFEHPKGVQKIEIFFLDFYRSIKNPEHVNIINEQTNNLTKKQTMSARTPFCGHCKNIGKQYNTHFTRKTPSQTSELVCPELLKKVCTDCKGRNHTFDKCPRPVSKVASKVAPNQAPSPASVASTVAVPAYKAALQTPKSKVASSVASNVAVPAYNYEDSYQYYSNYEEFSRSPTLNNASTSANAKEPVIQKTLYEYCEQLYELIAEHYPYRAGKITGMFLELDMDEILELIHNPASLQERLNEANEILDREYPWGYVDAMFKSICIHTRSSATNSDNIEVKPLDVREEYRKRVYAAHPTWHTSTINQIVEHFMRKKLSPEEIYEQFSDFERFKVEVKLTFAELNK